MQNGGIIAYPTEAVYGLGCNPYDPHAVARLLEIKQRPIEKGLILVAADFSQIEPLIEPLTPKQKQKLESTWPGHVTWLIKSRPEVPKWLTGSHHKIALRISNHPLVRELCAILGHPLVSTSANPSKKNPAKSALQVRRFFAGHLDYILSGALGKEKNPSLIRDFDSDVVVRNS